MRPCTTSSSYWACSSPLTAAGASYSYIVKKYPFGADAADYLSCLVDPPASGTSELITVDGKQLLRKLWDEAMKMSQVLLRMRRRGPGPTVRRLSPQTLA